jgi:hypothetical protein
MPRGSITNRPPINAEIFTPHLHGRTGQRGLGARHHRRFSVHGLSHWQRVERNGLYLADLSCPIVRVGAGVLGRRWGNSGLFLEGHRVAPSLSAGAMPPDTGGLQAGSMRSPVGRLGQTPGERTARNSNTADTVRRDCGPDLRHALIRNHAVKKQSPPIPALSSEWPQGIRAVAWVAARPHEGSRGFQPTETIIDPRPRVAERRMKSFLTNGRHPDPACLDA